ncbi:unnamed protein product [Phaeothamnion confervicola]
MQVGRSIVMYQQELDKIMKLDDSKLLAAVGPQADCSTFTEYIQKNMKLYELNNDLRLSTPAAANYIRGELAYALRQGPYQTNLLLAGVDGGTASLFWMDYLGALHKVSYAAHGYASNFTLGLLDREYREDITEADAVASIRRCIAELHKRFLISLPKFVIKVISADGIKIIE